MKTGRKLYRSFLVFALGMATLSSCKKEKLSELGEIHAFDLYSQQTQTTYSLRAVIPNTYNPATPAKMIYLLDGDDYLREAAEVIHKTGKTDHIVIGIGYKGKNLRGRDFSYPADPDFPGESGGGKNFLICLTEELIPNVETELGIPVKSRTLYGHSLGGFFSTYVFLQQDIEHPFTTIIAASPNLMWYNAYLFQLEEAYSKQSGALPGNLYMTMGDLEGASMNLAFGAFTEQLFLRDYDSLHFQYEKLENTSHRNSPIVSFENGLSLIP